jgi:hypothetical protein
MNSTHKLGNHHRCPVEILRIKPNPQKGCPRQQGRVLDVLVYIILPINEIDRNVTTFVLRRLQCRPDEVLQIRNLQRCVHDVLAVSSFESLGFRSTETAEEGGPEVSDSIYGTRILLIS